MIIQPFIENAIKHGLLHKKGSKTLSVSFELSAQMLKCTITDNGVGRAKAAEIRSRSPLQYKSFATKATEKRLVLINSSRKNRIDLDVADLWDGGLAAGTEVSIRIPL